jgi:hypothetical protein
MTECESCNKVISVEEWNKYHRKNYFRKFGKNVTEFGKCDECDKSFCWTCMIKHEVL